MAVWKLSYLSWSGVFAVGLDDVNLILYILTI